MTWRRTPRGVEARRAIKLHEHLERLESDVKVCRSRQVDSGPLRIARNLAHAGARRQPLEGLLGAVAMGVDLRGWPDGLTRELEHFGRDEHVDDVHTRPHPYGEL